MIETERLRLRRWREADLPAFAAMNADPIVRRYFSSRLTREESDASVARFILKTAVASQKRRCFEEFLGPMRNDSGHDVVQQRLPPVR